MTREKVIKMKIKKTFLAVTLILGSIQLTMSQKIDLLYKIKTIDSLSTFHNNAFSDKDIQTKANSIFRKNIQNRDIISIEDNINRRFEKIDLNHSTYYPKLLNDGYYKLYELKISDNPIYLIYSENDSLVLEKKDSIVNLASNQALRKDRKYNNKLVALCRDYPDLWEKAGKLEFSKEDFQDFISVLNDKHSNENVVRREKTRFDFLNLAVKGFVQANRKDLTLNILMAHYFINISSNFSLRYGLKANYFQRTLFVPEYFSGMIIYQNSHADSIFYYRDHYETMSAKILEIPFSVNFEITNSLLTPYFYAGLSPSVYFRKITRTDTYEINNISVLNLNAFAATGLKLKLTHKFNLLSEYKFELNKGLSFNVGMEYYFRL